MNEQLIEILEGQGLDQKQIADIMAEISQVNIGVLDPTTPLQGNSLTQIENELRDKWMQKLIGEIGLNSPLEL